MYLNTERLAPRGVRIFYFHSGGFLGTLAIPRVLTECYLRPRQSRKDRTLGLEKSAGLSSFDIVESGYTPRRRGGKVRNPRRDDDDAASPRQPESELSVGREGEDWVVLVAGDEEGRELRTTAPFEDQYTQLCSGMSCEAVIFSADYFETIYSTSEMFVPEVAVWVGPYPYLDHSEFRRFLGVREGRNKRRSNGVRSN